MKFYELGRRYFCRFFVHTAQVLVTREVTFLTQVYAYKSESLLYNELAG